MHESPIAILGGGITGLAAAHRLTELQPRRRWKLFEAGPRLGGVLQTVERDGWRVELSADNFLTRDPWATDLCRRVGLENELLPTDAARRRALVVSRGQIREVPEGFVLMAPRKLGPTLATPLLSLRGKLRLLREPFVARRRSEADESVAGFCRRRLGDEVFERIVQPLVGGIYTADPDRLSMAAAFPQFVRQEREHGSLYRAARAAAEPTSDASSGARYGLFVAPRGGFEQLIGAIAARLPDDRVALNTPVSDCEPTGDGWRLRGADGAALGAFAAVVVALPASAAAQTVGGFDGALGDELSSIAYAGASIVCLGVRDEQIAAAPNGFGFVVPAIERREILAASFASYKFPGRAPEGRTLIRVFVGGALQPELADRDDDALIAIARRELADLVGLSGEPELRFVARWPRRMPQYHVGHVQRVERIERAARRWPGLVLAGAAYRGVGVPQCVRSGEQAAERVLEQVTHDDDLTGDDDLTDETAVGGRPRRD